MEDFSFYPDLANQIVDSEINLRNRLVLDKSYDESMNLTLQAIQGARFFRDYIIERKFEEKASQQPLTVDDNKPSLNRQKSLKKNEI